MTRHSATTARVVGFIVFLLICAWDVDAMRPHIAAHSWTTLAFVSLFLAAHLSDYLTIGRLVNRLDSLSLDSLTFDLLTFANADEMVGAVVGYERRESSVLPRKPPEHYVFTTVTAVEAKAAGAPYPIALQTHHRATGLVQPATYRDLYPEPGAGHVGTAPAPSPEWKKSAQQRATLLGKGPRNREHFEAISTANA
jgi:hypothetical protein